MCDDRMTQNVIFCREHSLSKDKLIGLHFHVKNIILVLQIIDCDMGYREHVKTVRQN